MTFTTNEVKECVPVKQLHWKARIKLSVIGSRLCHTNKNDFHLVENAWATFVKTISTLNRIKNFYTKIKAFSESVSRVNHRGRKYLKYKPKEENICFQTICEKSLPKKKKKTWSGRTILMIATEGFCTHFVWSWKRTNGERGKDLVTSDKSIRVKGNLKRKEFVKEEVKIKAYKSTH